MDIALETTFDIKFTSRAFSTGIPTTLAGTPAVEIYEDNSTIQITAAETLTVDFDAVTGLNNLRIAATAANGFELGKSYSAVISAGTVDGVSVVGETIANFSIGRSAAAADLANGTDGLSALKTLIDTVDTVADGIKAVTDNLPNSGALNDLDAAGIRSAVGLAAADLDTQLSGIDGKIVTVDTVVDAIKAVTDFLPDGGALSDVSAIKAVTDFLPDGGALSSLTANVSAILVDTGTSLPSTLATIAGYIDTEVAAIKAVTDLLPNGGSLNDLAAILTDTGTTLPSLLTTIDTVVDAIKVVTDRLNALVENSAGDRFTTKALEAAPSGGGGGDATEAKQDSIIALIGTPAVDLAADIAALDLAGGSGANSITVTVTDGTNPVQGASVGVYLGAVLKGAGTTDASGNVAMSLDNGTYTVAVSAENHTHTPESRTVTGAEAGTLVNDIELTAVSIPAAPADASLCTVYGYVETIDNLAAASLKIIVRLVEATSGSGLKSNKILRFKETLVIKTDAAGDVIPVDLQRNDLITPAGSYYEVTCKELGLDKVSMTLAAATFDLATLIS